MSSVKRSAPADHDLVSGQAGTGRPALQRLVLAIPVAIVLVGGWVYRWTFDDGFIYLRIVRNLRSGHGPVFNVGERVETYTGTLWVFLLAAADLVMPIRLEWIAALLGLLCTGLGVVFAMAGAVHLQRRVDRSAFLVPVGAAVYVAIMPVWVWTTSGLEIGLALMWLGGVWWILARWATADRAYSLVWWQAVVVGLGWLIRPDLVLLSATVFVVVVVEEWRHGRRREAGRVAVWMLALPVAYQVFRMGYFGLLMPNTALAKEGSRSVWSRGWEYLRDFGDQYWLWLPLVALAIGVMAPLVSALVARGERRSVLVVGVFAGSSLALAVYVVRVGGDYLHARMLLPSLFMLCAVCAVAPLHRRSLAASIVVPWAVVSIVVMRPAQVDTFIVNGTVLPNVSGSVTSDDFGVPDDAGLSLEPGLYLRHFSARPTRVDGAMLQPDAGDTVIIASGVGLVSFTSPGVRVFDLQGLGDPLASRFDVSDRAVLAGHEKYTEPEWVAARLIQPGTSVRPAQLSTNPVRLPAGTRFAERIEQARRALECPRVQRAIDAATAPMSIRRFVSNLVRSFGNTQLRLPNDPVEAREVLCDD